eukprot:jgi/Botrbrau1/18159/Bobra.53_1s0029.1
MTLQGPQCFSMRCTSASSPTALVPAGHSQVARRSSLMTVPSRRTAHSTRAVAFANTATFAATNGTAWLSSAASALGFAIGAVWIVREMMMEQERSESDGDVECPTCGGTGYVECFCTRWSDGDGGCGTCQGTLKMTCNGCGGTGTGIPLAARVMAHRRGPLINVDNRRG